MITTLFDRAVVRILTLLSISPGSRFTRCELKKKTLLNNIPLDKALNCLAKEGIVKKEKRLLSLNFENDYSKKVLEIARKEYLRFKELPLNIYFMLVDASSMLANYAEKVYLFGSYAKLIYTDKSDIDLAIILKKEHPLTIRKLKGEIAKLEKKHQKAIELHFFKNEELKQNDPLVKEIKRNSIALF